MEPVADGGDAARARGAHARARRGGRELPRVLRAARGGHPRRQAHHQGGAVTRLGPTSDAEGAGGAGDSARVFDGDGRAGPCAVRGDGGSHRRGGRGRVAPRGVRGRLAISS